MGCHVYRLGPLISSLTVPLQKKNYKNSIYMGAIFVLILQAKLYSLVAECIDCHAS